MKNARFSITRETLGYGMGTVETLPDSIEPLRREEGFSDDGEGEKFMGSNDSME
jgi:hypothetical protein